MDPISVLAGSAVAVLFLAAALRRPTAARIALSALFLASAVFNATVTYPARDRIYLDMVAGPYVPDLYRDFTLAFVVGNAALFTALVVGFELAVACLLLARGRWVKLALVGAAGWLLAMWLFAPPEGIVLTAIAQIGAAFGCALMLRLDFQATIPESLARTFLPRSERARA